MANEAAEGRGDVAPGEHPESKRNVDVETMVQIFPYVMFVNTTHWLFKFIPDNEDA